MPEQTLTTPHPLLAAIPHAGGFHLAFPHVARLRPDEIPEFFQMLGAACEDATGECAPNAQAVEITFAAIVSPIARVAASAEATAGPYHLAPAIEMPGLPDPEPTPTAPSPQMDLPF